MGSHYVHGSEPSERARLGLMNEILNAPCRCELGLAGDERVLRDTALAGEGAYIPAGTERVDMARAYAQTVGLLERQESDASIVTRRTPRFQWFAGVAFACLLGATLVPAPRLRREVLR